MIAEQIKKAKATIQREEDEFGMRTERDAAPYGRSGRPASSHGDASSERPPPTAGGEEGSAAAHLPRSPIDATTIVAETLATSEALPQPPPSGPDKSHPDDAGDEVVVADEDMVIY